MSKQNLIYCSILFAAGAHTIAPGSNLLGEGLTKNAFGITKLARCDTNIPANGLPSGIVMQVERFGVHIEHQTTAATAAQMDADVRNVVNNVVARVESAGDVMELGPLAFWGGPSEAGGLPPSVGAGWHTTAPFQFAINNAGDDAQFRADVEKGFTLTEPVKVSFILLGRQGRV